MKNLVVIEDFYKNPLAVRDYALTRCRYLNSDKTQNEFPGTESEQGFFSADVVRKIEDAIGEKVDVNPKQFSFGVFSKTYFSDQPKKSIHVDSSDWTAIVYLSLPEHCQGGTVLYESKEYGWSSIPAEKTLKDHGFASRAHFINTYLKENSKNFDLWNVTCRVGMKFNRMVVFRSHEMFHAAEGYFGNNDYDCRLMQLFFFKTQSEGSNECHRD